MMTTIWFLVHISYLSFLEKLKTYSTGQFIPFWDNIGSKLDVLYTYVKHV